MKICDFTMPEIRHLMAESNFTKDEMEIFLLFSKGCTIEEAAERSNLSVSTVKRIKNRIWNKIERIKSL